MGAALNSRVFPVPPSVYTVDQFVLEGLSPFWIEEPGGDRVLGVKIVPSTKPTGVLLYSHGNAEDIESGLAYLEALGRALNVVVIAYEYFGYGPVGESRGPNDKPSERHIYTDAASLSKWIQRTYPNIPVIVYGRSLGTAAALRSAIELGDQAVLTVLQSPFLSILSTRFPSSVVRLVGKLDLFVNTRLLARLTSKLLVVHGKLDALVPHAHGAEIVARYSGNPVKHLLTMDASGHNDIQSDPRNVALIAGVIRELLSI